MKTILIRDAELCISPGRDLMIAIDDDGNVKLIKSRIIKKNFDIETIDGEELIK